VVTQWAQDTEAMQRAQLEVDLGFADADYS
jgi:hypothetical protein